MLLIHCGVFNQNKILFGGIGHFWLPWLAWIFKFNFQCLIQSDSRGSLIRKVGDTLKCYGHNFQKESWGVLVKKWVFSGSEYYKTKRHGTSAIPLGGAVLKFTNKRYTRRSLLHRWIEVQSFNPFNQSLNICYYYRKMSRRNKKP